MTMILTRLRAVLRLAGELTARLPYSAHECVVCGHRLGRFLPYRGGRRGRPALMRALETVGSDVEHFSCPWCHAHDRERHLLLYMREAGILSSLAGKHVLHFAPEGHLSRLIRAAGPAEYVKCDMYPWAADIIRMDLMDLRFSDHYFDLVIANHVLEHVDDDRRAVSEIARVLRPGGYAILQTPYSPVLEHTWEDAGIRAPEARHQAYGQEDHVRLFGRDIFARIADQGMKSRVQMHTTLLRGYSAERLGLNPNEPFFLFVKPGSENETR